MATSLRVSIVFMTTFGVQLSGGEAATYFVAPTGNDSNIGAIDSPFATFTKAINQARAGDIILARGGTYDLTNSTVYCS